MMWEVPIMTKAKTLYEFMNVFSPFPLDGDNFNEFYVDTESVRGTEMKKMAMSCLYGGNPFAKILFSGHMGSGKTTEVYKLAKDISSEYEVVKISLMKDLDLYNLSYIDLIFEIMSAIILHVDGRLGMLSDSDMSMFNQLYNYWHAEYFKTEITNEDSEYVASVDGGMKAEQSVSLGSGLLAKFKFLVHVAVNGQGIFRTSTQTKDDLKVKIEPRMRDLISAINSMIVGINRSIAPKKLLIIIEDLDKADSLVVEDLFGKHQTQLFAINVKTIYMLPIYFKYSLDFKRVKDNADASYVLNTISVLDRNKHENVENVEFFKQFVYKRADERFFDDDALKLMIRKSGGILRDLFSLLVDASLNAVIDHPDIELITMEDAEKACVKLRTEYVKTIETQQHYEKLMQVYSNSDEVFEDRILMDLLRANMVIECGEDKFYLVHPLIVDYMMAKGDIQ